MWQPYQSDSKPIPIRQILPTWLGILVAIAPLGFFPLLEMDPLAIASGLRVEAVLVALTYPGWVAATAVKTRSVGPVIVVAALVPALSIAYLLLSADRTAAEIAGNLDAFLALAIPPAVVAAVTYGLIELGVAVIGRIDPSGGGGTARSVFASLAGLVVAGAFVAVIGWLAYGVVGFSLTS